MIGLVLSWVLLASLCACTYGLALRKIAGLDPAEAIGVSGLLAMGVLGWVSFWLGLPQGALRIGISIGLPLILGLGAIAYFRGNMSEVVRFRRPADLQLGALALIIVGVAVSIFGALAPSQALDWDSLAYHLALPKLWLQADAIRTVPFIHQSYFPAGIDSLFVWGLRWGESGAKGMNVGALTFGCLALFGVCRRQYGAPAGWWSALLLLGIPVVMWESGTAYVDATNALFTGLGCVYLASYAGECCQVGRGRVAWLALGSTLLAFACASKYTSNVVMVAVIASAAAALFAQRRKCARVGPGVAALVGACFLAWVVFASPWYIRNAVVSGNPVYPFLYERFGGEGWDSWRASIYQNEQQSFGVGRVEGGGRDWTQFPSSILGLGYQPGRYANPRQETGGGFPVASIGFAVALGGLCAAVLRTGGIRERILLASVLVCSITWFALSQQSRYFVGFAVPLIPVVACAIRPGRAGWILGGAVVAQLGFSLVMMFRLTTFDQMRVVLGQVTRDEFLSARVSFFQPSRAINQLPKSSKVALYDEVFGYLLDVPYLWANPGHSRLILYENVPDGDTYVEELQRLGVTHVYVNLEYAPPTEVERWAQVSGLADVPGQWTPEEREKFLGDLGRRWWMLVAEAASQGRLRAIQIWPRAVLFEVSP